MDAATYLVTYAFLTHVKPYPFLLLMALLLGAMFRFGWIVANDVRTYRRIEHRFSRIR